MRLEIAFYWGCMVVLGGLTGAALSVGWFILAGCIVAFMAFVVASFHGYMKEWSR